jgi:hypothetical protein
MFAVAGACSLVLLNAIHVGPGWVHSVASVVALATALAVLVAGQLGWERTVATAQAAGLIATSGSASSFSRKPPPSGGG